MGAFIQTAAAAPANYGVPRNVFNLLNGDVAVVIPDGSNFEIYTSTDRITWTLRATFVASFPASGWANWWCSGLGDTNNIHIAWRDVNSAMRYVKATWATGNVYTFGTAETIADALANNVDRYDIDVINGDVPVFACIKTASPVTFQIYIRRTSTSTWFLSYSLQISNGGWTGWPGVSISRDAGGPVSGSSRMAFAVTVPDRTRYSGDIVGLGLNLNLSTGAITNAPVIISNLFTATSKSLNRDYQLFSPSSGRYDLAQAIGAGSLDLRISRYSNTGVIISNSAAPVFAGKARNAYARQTNDFDRVKFAHSGHSLMFMYQAILSDNQLHSVQLTATTSDTAINWIPPNDPGTNHDWWDTYTTSTNVDQGVTGLYGGGNRNLVTGVGANRIATMTYRASDKRWTFKENPQASSPTTYYPAAGATVDSNTPTVQVQILGQQRPQARVKAYYQIAKDSAFTVSVKTILAADSEYGAIPRTGVNTVTNKLILSKTLDKITPLAQGTWYIRTAVMDPWGRFGAWGASSSFTVSHPANAIHLAPSNGQVYAYGSGDITFTWDFSSAWSGSRQTAFQHLIENVSDPNNPVQITDTGQVTSAVDSVTINLGTIIKSVPLRWRVRVWDEDGVVGPYSAYAPFSLADASSVIILDPADFQADAIASVTADTKTFEGGTVGGWILHPNSPPGSTMVVSSAWANTGTKSLLWTSGGTAAINASYVGEYVIIPTTPGVTYTATVVINQPTKVGSGVYLGAYSNVGATMLITSSTATAAGVVTKSVTFTANDVNILLCVLVDTTTIAVASGAQFYVDDLQMTTTQHDVVTSPTPAISWDTQPPAADLTVVQRKFRVQITDTVTNQIVVDSIWIPGIDESWIPPAGKIANNGSYSVTVSVEDSNGLQTMSPANLFTSSWTAPATPGATISGTSYSTLGYISATWTDAAMDTGFVSWRVYRRVTGTTTWVMLAEYFQDQTSYTYQDDMAVTGVSYDYAVVQSANRFGSIVESVYNTVTITGQSDDYWLVGYDATDPTLRLENVTADSYSDEYEEEVIELIGRGRHVEYGTHWGYKGSLTARLYDTVGGLTARQKRQAILDAKVLRKSWALRNPFGDIWLVAISDISITRMAGVGQREFVELTIPYTQLDADADY